MDSFFDVGIDQNSMDIAVVLARACLPVWLWALSC